MLNSSILGFLIQFVYYITFSPSLYGYPLIPQIKTQVHFTTYYCRWRKVKSLNYNEIHELLVATLTETKEVMWVS